MYQKVIKRGSDIIASFLAIVVLFPLLAVVYLLVLILDRENPIFTQRRIGKNGQEFLMYKFRSMKIDAPEIPTGDFDNVNEYITPIGKVLRKTSIDELPQLVNILRGEMSFVGPRPALWNETDLITARDAEGINSILPGLTGWAQVNGRAKLSLNQRINFDREYVNLLNCGGIVACLMDIKCILKTFIVVFKFRDVT